MVIVIVMVTKYDNIGYRAVVKSCLVSLFISISVYISIFAIAHKKCKMMFRKIKNKNVTFGLDLT